LRGSRLEGRDDALTDSIAGFFEGRITEWLRSHGFSEAREAVTTSLGKMSGCLMGSGFVLSVATLSGIQLTFAKPTYPGRRISLSRRWRDKRKRRIENQEVGQRRAKPLAADAHTVRLLEEV
jgi:hypothetical protein